MSEQSTVIPLLLPQVGNSMEEGTILKWHVQPGARIKPGDVLYELETDKASMDIEAEVGGRLARIVVPEGQLAPVKTPIAYLAETDAEVDALLGGSAPEPAKVPETVAAKVPTAPTAPAVTATQDLDRPSRARVSPAARKAAEVLGVPIAAVSAGSGPGGRVVRADVEKAASQPKPAPKPVVPSTPAASLGGERVPMTKMRKAIARNLQLSKQTVPHFYVKLAVKADAMLAFYKDEKALYPCSMNDVITLACARAIMEFPAFRTQVDGDDYVIQPNANIGIAVALDEGLVVPVLMRADNYNLKGLAAESKRLVEAARDGKVENVGQGVFSISNMGMFGVDEFSAIINPPEAAILAVGAAREGVIVERGAMRAGRIMNLTLSIDHRVADGATAAKFMGRVRELLEDPRKLA